LDAVLNPTPKYESNSPPAEYPEQHDHLATDTSHLTKRVKLLPCPAEIHYTGARV